jgi:hypothetical protein
MSLNVRENLIFLQQLYSIKWTEKQRRGHRLFSIHICFMPTRKIRVIKGNAKCLHIKKLTCKGNLWHVFICLRPRSLSPPPLLTHCTCTVCKRVCSIRILIHTGKGGKNCTRQKVRGATVHKAGSKIPA